MYGEAHVGFIYTHTKGLCGDQYIYLVALKVLCDLTLLVIPVSFSVPALGLAAGIKVGVGQSFIQIALYPYHTVFTIYMGAKNYSAVRIIFLHSVKMICGSAKEIRNNIADGLNQFILLLGTGHPDDLVLQFLTVKCLRCNYRIIIRYFQFSLYIFQYRRGSSTGQRNNGRLHAISVKYRSGRTPYVKVCRSEIMAPFRYAMCLIHRHRKYSVQHLHAVDTLPESANLQPFGRYIYHDDSRVIQLGHGFFVIVRYGNCTIHAVVNQIIQLVLHKGNQRRYNDNFSWAYQRCQLVNQ